MMIRTVTPIGIAMLLAAAVSAQEAPPAEGTATAPTMVRAAGMPLPDGALPPGSLTVRLVQGAFTGDLAGIPVEIELPGGERRQAPTGAKGRAEFAHLPIGAQVRASATVGHERLQSDPFAIPADSGVRVLLVANGGTGAAVPPPPPAPEPATSGVRPVAGPSPQGVTIVRVTVVSLTVLAFALVMAQQARRRRPHQARTRSRTADE